MGNFHARSSQESCLEIERQRPGKLSEGNARTLFPAKNVYYTAHPGNRGASMTLYIRPHGDDKNDGSSVQKAVRTAHQAAKIALRIQDWEINIHVFDLDRICRELDHSRGFRRSQALT